MDTKKAKTRKHIKQLVVINSKIIVSENPFSYTENRSIYTTLERYEQTLDSISSVRRHIPESYILFVDNSPLPSDMASRIRSEVEVFLNPQTDTTLNHDTDVNPVKAVGELAQVILALRHVDALDFAWNNLFKICGRYVLNAHFDLSQYENKHNIFKVNEPLTRYKTDVHPPPKKTSSPFEMGLSRLASLRQRIAAKLFPNRLPVPEPQGGHGRTVCYFTSFYKISKRNYSQYKKALLQSYTLFKSDPVYWNEPLELVFCDRVCDKAVLDTLGVTINAAVENWIEEV